MQKIIILRGAPSSGKSTIARRLRNFKKKVAWLKVDNFKPFFAEDASGALNYVNLTALVTLKYLVNEGFSVVMEGIFQEVDVIKKAENFATKNNIPYKIFQLFCPPEALIMRDLNREGVKEGCRKPLGDEVINTIFNKLEDNYYNGAVKLDTERNDLDKCIEIIKSSFEED